MGWHSVPPKVAQKIRRNGAKFGIKDVCFKYHPFTARSDVATIYFTGFAAEDTFKGDIHIGSRLVIRSDADCERVKSGIEDVCEFSKWLEEYHNEFVSKEEGRQE